jgi:hypothetical protein
MDGVDINIIDQNFSQLQAQGQRTVASIQSLAQKLQAAAAAGDQQAREWLLDLKGAALEFQQEQNQVNLLHQSVRNYAADMESRVRQAQTPPANSYQQPGYQQPVYQQPTYQRGPGGGLLQTFGTMAAAGAGFAIGEEIIDDIFDW